MRVNRRKFLTLTSAGLASTMVSCSVQSVEAEGLAAAQGSVDSLDSFAKATRKARAGDTIVIANGRYDGWSADLDCRGTSERPVTIRPESAGGVVFTGRSHFSITGSHVTLDGLTFEHCDFKQNLLDLRRSDHCRIVNCVFENSGGERAAIGLSPGSRKNRITDCRFTNIAARCVNLQMSDRYTNTEFRLEMSFVITVSRIFPGKGQMDGRQLRSGRISRRLDTLLQAR